MECELSRTYVSAVERSRWNVSLSNIEHFAQALDVEAWTLLKPYLFTGAGNRCRLAALCVASIPAPSPQG